MSSILFKKEIKRIYESFKCNFSDGDLNSITRSEDEWNSGRECQATVLSLLIEEQGSLIEFYKTITARLWEEGEFCALCMDHLDQLKELNKMLIAENNLLHQTRIQDENYGIVA